MGCFLLFSLFLTQKISKSTKNGSFLFKILRFLKKQNLGKNVQKSQILVFYFANSSNFLVLNLISLIISPLR